MKIKALLIASIIFTGCTTTNHMCDTYSNCDEFYPYSCSDSIKFIAYTPREYKKHVRRNWDYTDYYPNTQTVYYTPVYINQNCDDPNITTRRPRPPFLSGGSSNSGGSLIESTPNGTHRPPTHNASISRKNRD
jgi:hypothetical protein